MIISMNFGRIRGRSKNLHQKIFYPLCDANNQDKQFVPQPALALSQFSLEKRKCIQEILPFENSRIYTFENLMRVWGNFHCQFSQFTTQPRKRTKRTCTTRRKNRARKKGITLLSGASRQCFIPSCSLLQNQICCHALLTNFYHTKKYPLGQISFITIMTILSEFIRV